MEKLECLPLGWAYNLPQPKSNPDGYMVAHDENGNEALVPQPYNFASGEDMLKEIQDGTDMYCPETTTYVFAYNDVGAIAYYDIDYDEAQALETKSRELDDYWSACLGPGGWICDDPSDKESPPNPGCANIDFCNDLYMHQWIPTDNVVCGVRQER